MTTPAPLELDVRPELARGGEPFEAIMAAVGQLAPGQQLRLIAPFRPVPLFNVMKKQGFTVADRQMPDGGWEVLFTPEAPARPEEALSTGTASGAAQWPDPVRMLDLCDLMPPEPMVRILEAVEIMQPGEVLFAALDREPIFLFPELASRNHEWAGNFGGEDNSYRLLIRCGTRDE